MPSPAELADLMEEAREAFAEMNQGETVPTVPADTLKRLLPETLAGMGRTEASAQRSQAMGIDMTNAEAEYESPEGAWIILTITDIGSVGGPLRMAMTAWAQMEYSEEIGSSYERTGTYHGFRGVEEYDKDSKDGAIRVLVADRFVVEIEGSHITMEILKKALSELDLKRMAALASDS